MLFKTVGKLLSLGVVGLAIVLFFYGLSVLAWSWVLMLVLGAAGVHWSYHHAILPFGLIIPFVLG